jgi:hypothetical protein
MRNESYSSVQYRSVIHLTGHYLILWTYQLNAANAKFTLNKLRIRRRYQIYTVQCLQLTLTCKLCLQYRHVHLIKVYPHFYISEQIKLNKNAVHHATTCSSMLNQLSWSSVLTFRLATGHD